jgi:hypothetical protein
VCSGTKTEEPSCCEIDHCTEMVGFTLSLSLLTQPISLAIFILCDLQYLHWTNVFLVAINKGVQWFHRLGDKIQPARTIHKAMSVLDYIIMQIRIQERSYTQ